MSDHFDVPLEPDDEPLDETDDESFGEPIPASNAAWRQWVRGDARDQIALDLDLTRSEVDAMISAQATVASTESGTPEERLARVAGLLDLITSHCVASLLRGPDWADPGPVFRALIAVAKLRLAIIHTPTDNDNEE